LAIRVPQPKTLYLGNFQLLGLRYEANWKNFPDSNEVLLKQLVEATRYVLEPFVSTQDKFGQRSNRNSTRIILETVGS
jgi:hypothetical protein